MRQGGQTNGKWQVGQGLSAWATIFNDSNAIELDMGVAGGTS